MLEYADVVWDNITTQDEIELEKIQQEAARIISGGTRLASLQNLYNETALEPLKNRRIKHKLTNFYKMYNSTSPSYFCTLIPSSIGDSSAYSLRNSNNIRSIQCKSQLFSRSFLPSTINLWNNLPESVRTAPSLSAFKANLNKDKKNNSPALLQCRAAV